MLKYFRIEWMKIKTYRTFWVLFLTFVISFPLIYYFSASEYMDSDLQPGAEGLRSILGAPFVFPNTWLSSSWFAGLFFVVIGMLFILLITNEVQYRTHRQNIIDGWSRTQFLLAKASVMIFFVIVSTVLVFVSALWVGSAFSSAESKANVFENVHYVGYFALMALMYLMVAFLTAILVKRTGLSIIIYFAVVCIVDNLLWLSLTAKGSQLGYFTPLETTDSLVVNPFKPQLLETRTAGDMSLIIGAVVYLSLFAFIITNRFRNSDLKT